MILAPLSALTHHVHRRPACASWLAFSDGFDVRLFGASPHWQLNALEALQQLAESAATLADGVTRTQIDAHDFEHCADERISPRAPYYWAHIFGATVAQAARNRLGVSPLTHALETTGIRDYSHIPPATRPNRETEAILRAVSRMRIT